MTHSSSGSSGSRSYSPGARVLAFTLLLASPVLLLLVAEGTLRLMAYGVEPTPFVTHPGDQRYWVDNPDNFHNKYHARTRPDGLGQFPNLFLKEKPENLLRGIVIGGSTAQGAPYRPNQSFAKMTQAAVNTALGERRLEIVNLAGSALTSFYVRDVARYLPRYQPDFVIIYSGHNEYYGTPSSADGQAPWVLRLYTRLKDFRVAQLLFNLLQPSADVDAALMERRFANSRFPPDSTRDRHVAEAFVDNIDAAVSSLNQRGIPVYVFRPVANEADFPPFDGNHEARVRELIQRHATLKDPEVPRDELVKAQQRLPESSHLCWLRGRLPSLDRDRYLRCGVDRDNIPFRARSALLDALDAYAADRAGDDLFRYVHTGRYLRENAGLLDNRLFIDQLHFGITGNVMVSRLLAGRLSIDFFRPRARQIAAFFAEEVNVRNAVRLTPFDEVFAALRMKLQLNNPPYTGMLIPFDFRIERYLGEGRHFLEDSVIFRTVLEYQQREAIVKALNGVFMRRNSLYRLEQQLLSEVWNNPGHAYWYEQLGSLYMAFEQSREKGLGYWRKAWRLSFDKSDMKARLRKAHGEIESIEPWDKVFQKIKTGK